MAKASDLDEVCRLTGETVLTWSNIELLWYLIFTTLLSETPRNKVDALYFHLETDSKRRLLVLALSECEFPPNAKTKKPHETRTLLGQLFAQTNELAGERNAIAHATLVPVLDDNFLPQIVVSPGSHPTKKNKLAGKELLGELQGTIKKLDDLYKDLRNFLDSRIPSEQRYMPPDLLEALQKQGLEVPSWAIPTPTPKADDPKPQPPLQS